MALTTAEVAAELDTTPKTLRRFLRADVKANGGQVGVDTPGKGKRYSFEKGEISKMRKQFVKWQKAQADLRAERAAKAAEEAENTEVTE